MSSQLGIIVWCAFHSVNVSLVTLLTMHISWLIISTAFPLDPTRADQRSYSNFGIEVVGALCKKEAEPNRDIFCL